MPKNMGVVCPEQTTTKSTCFTFTQYCFEIAISYGVAIA